HRGYALGQVDLAQEIDSSGRSVRARFTVTAGIPVLIGKIRFAGNATLKEAHLRRHLRVQEGRIFDARALDESIERLNRSGLVSQMNRSDLQLEVDSFENTVDITFQIKEKDRHGIFGTGGSGGIGGSYLGFIYRAVNLLGLGEELALELDGGAAQSNFLLDVVGRHVLGSPFTLALSAFHRATDFNVASVVPDADDLVSLLRRKSTGIGLSGAYAISARTSLGLGVHHERVSTTVSPGNAESTSSGRTGLAPTLLLDFTRAAGPQARGDRFLFSQNWIGSSTLTTLQSASQSLRIQAYRGDPWTSGRNSFAFRLQGDLVHALDKSPLDLDQRIYAGDEVVRGFPRGGLSPWRISPADGQDTIGPAGADRVLGLSSEYRIPLSGRLSGAAFFDLGWSRLSPSQEPAGGLLAATNGLLRGSLGGELRLQLPVLDQPGRMIFAWNPLRLDRLVSAGPSPLRLADPRGVVRFALGGVF
ncbi:MAG: BamA/TamA family outer membrane protein, partial [Acidobacteriota bacterium]